MKVEKLQPSRHVKGRYLLFLEDETLIKVTEGELLDFSLYVGRDLSDEELTRLREKARRSNARARAVSIIGRRALSTEELRRRLIEKGESEDDAQDAVDWLTEIGALDDARYAQSVVRHYASMGYGPAKIRDELYRRRVPRDLWDDAMEEEDPADAIDRYLASKLRHVSERDPKTLKRLGDGLRRRGFRWDDIRDALRRLEEEQ